MKNEALKTYNLDEMLDKHIGDLKTLDQFIDEQYGKKGIIKRNRLEKALIALTEEHKNEILESKKEVEQGLSIEHELLDKRVSEWLRAK